jgi:hypothetical protein
MNTFSNYLDFFNWTVELAANKGTSGDDQTDEHKEFTQLNYKRMEKWNKIFHVSEEVKQILNSLTIKQHWYVITETWCGDSAQNLPIIAKIAEASAGKIQLTILMRDKNPEWMNRYLTNGAKSVPKLIAFDEQENELFTWGPRPEEGMVITRHWQANKDTITKEQFHLDLHTFYAFNKGLAVQSELAELLRG